MTPAKRPSHAALKIAISRSYWDVVDLMTWCFLSCRISLMPLECYHRLLPKEGRIVEVGCGHGVITQYLARRGEARAVIGYEPDERRATIAQRAARGISNLEYRQGYFESSLQNGLVALVIIGVLYLLDDETCLNVLSTARNSLGAGGVFLLSDIWRKEQDLRYEFHLRREHWFKQIGFTQGQGLFVRSPETWKELLHKAGFNRIEPFEAPVLMHSVFNWICQ